jgi:hypothetical protein
VIDNEILKLIQAAVRVIKTVDELNQLLLLVRQWGEEVLGWAEIRKIPDFLDPHFFQVRVLQPRVNPCRQIVGVFDAIYG